MAEKNSRVILWVPIGSNVVEERDRHGLVEVTVAVHGHCFGDQLAMLVEGRDEASGAGGSFSAARAIHPEPASVRHAQTYGSSFGWH